MHETGAKKQLNKTTIYLIISSRFFEYMDFQHYQWCDILLDGDKKLLFQIQVNY
jgi:hypothetical protein